MKIKIVACHDYKEAQLMYELCKEYIYGKVYGGGPCEVDHNDFIQEIFLHEYNLRYKFMDSKYINWILRPDIEVVYPHDILEFDFLED